MLRALLKTLRPHQWFKNVFVAAALVFSLRLGDADAVLRTLAAVALFSLISGCVYVLNDLLDVAADRLHPTKRNRPIPSGALPVRVAWVFFGVATPTLLVLGFVLDRRFGGVLTSYMLLNVAYSLYLKQIPFLDVLLIAGFFMLRVLAGAYAISVPASPWLIGCAFLLSLFLAVGKRVHELATAQDAPGQRAVLARYDLRSLRLAMWGLGVVTILVYMAYTLSEHTVTTFGTKNLVLTTPSVLVGVFRYVQLVSKRHEAESPTEEMLKDRIFMGNLAIYAMLVALVLYAR
ncbi:MAG: decaprenyl-phosphate phosphoribosyltransferase [Deltaproteobacteria bacterium]|nr:MAG: decaprenyl-phosphate phosphoribosyltransferase [Deltaproteobacteria bacterium]